MCGVETIFSRSDSDKGATQREANYSCVLCTAHLKIVSLPGSLIGCARADLQSTQLMALALWLGAEWKKDQMVMSSAKGK
jgi:hypothetical protein